MKIQYDTISYFYAFVIDQSEMGHFVEYILIRTGIVVFTCTCKTLAFVFSRFIIIYSMYRISVFLFIFFYNYFCT